MDLTIFRLSTLEAMKRDALSVLADYEMPVDKVIRARRVVISIDTELTRRMDWATAASTFINGDI